MKTDCFWLMAFISHAHLSEWIYALCMHIRSKRSLFYSQLWISESSHVCIIVLIIVFIIDLKLIVFTFYLTVCISLLLDSFFISLHAKLFIHSICKHLLFYSFLFINFQFFNHFFYSLHTFFLTFYCFFHFLLVRFLIQKIGLILTAPCETNLEGSNTVTGKWNT